MLEVDVLVTQWRTIQTSLMLESTRSCFKGDEVIIGAKSTAICTRRRGDWAKEEGVWEGRWTPSRTRARSIWWMVRMVRDERREWQDRERDDEGDEGARQGVWKQTKLQYIHACLRLLFFCTVEKKERGKEGRKEGMSDRRDQKGAGQH